MDLPGEVRRIPSALVCWCATRVNEHVIPRLAITVVEEKIFSGFRGGLLTRLPRSLHYTFKIRGRVPAVAGFPRGTIFNSDSGYTPKILVAHCNRMR